MYHLERLHMKCKRKQTGGAERMQIITTAIIKGGGGKTTTCTALAQAAAADGKRVLAIDLDPQGNCTFSIGANQNAPGSYDLLHGADPAQLIQHTAQGIDAIPAAPDLATEQTKPASARRLQTALEPIKKGYDFIFIDTGPTLGELTYNALQAATGLLVPLEADFYGLQGLYQICDIAHQIQGRSNPGLHLLGCVITRYDKRSKINRHWRSVIEEKGAENGAPLLAAIRAGVAIKEAQAMQQSLFEYAPRSKAAQDYKDLYDTLKRGGK